MNNDTHPQPTGICSIGACNDPIVGYCETHSSPKLCSTHLSEHVATHMRAFLPLRACRVQTYAAAGWGVRQEQHTRRYAWCHTCCQWSDGVPGDRCPDCGGYLVVNPLADDWKPSPRAKKLPVKNGGRETQV